MQIHAARAPAYTPGRGGLFRPFHACAFQRITDVARRGSRRYIFFGFFGMSFLIVPQATRAPPPPSGLGWSE
jgi:hypothetical protein